jgi:rhamnosyltransferase
LDYKNILAIVISYNGKQNLIKTVNALSGKVGHTLVVDNGSDKESLLVIETLESRQDVSICYLGQNKGIGYALNKGVDWALKQKFEWILSMDQDSIIDVKMVEEFCQVITKHPQITCLAPLVNVFGDTKGFNRGDLTKQIYPVKYAITSGNLVKTSTITNLNGYDESLFIDGVDFDFSLKVKSLGEEIFLVPQSKLYHSLGAQHNLPSWLSRFYTAHSPLRRYYMFRNWGYIFQRYFFKHPFFILKSTFLHILLFLLILIYDDEPRKSARYIFYGIKDYFKNRTGPFYE